MLGVQSGLGRIRSRRTAKLVVRWVAWSDLWVLWQYDGCERRTWLMSTAPTARFQTVYHSRREPNVVLPAIRMWQWTHVQPSPQYSVTTSHQQSAALHAGRSWRGSRPLPPPGHEDRDETAATVWLHPSSGTGTCQAAKTAVAPTYSPLPHARRRQRVDQTGHLFCPLLSL